MLVFMDLGEGLRQALAKLSRATIIDAKTIKEFNKELQKTLLSSDVEVGLVFKLTKAIEDKALKSRPPAGLDPREYITNIVYDELVRLMGHTYAPKMGRQKILLSGLYGSGKTTTAAKLAKYYQDRGFSAGVICCDVVRPAAYEQLETLARQANVGFFGIKGEKNAALIAEKGLHALKDRKVVICDTSGRNALDSQLIDELKAVNKSFAPDEKILVVSADIGQVAGRQAREFDSAITLTGVVITKMDGSGKGGGALSASNAANSKVLFIGIGEKLKDLEPYDSDRFIEELLGIPNISKLVEHVQNAIAEADLKPEEVEIDKFNFESFYAQLKTLNKVGPLKNVFGMMGAPDVPKDMLEKSEEKLQKYKVIIASMTPQERSNEKLIHDAKRIKRIAIGSGTTEKDVHELLSDFNKMKKSFNLLKNDRNMKRFFSKFN